MTSIKRPICETCRVNMRLSFKMHRLYINVTGRSKHSVNSPIGWICLVCRNPIIVIKEQVTRTIGVNT